MFGDERDGQFYCDCKNGETWSTNDFKCVKVGGNGQVTKKGMPGWGIALIIIFVLLALAALIFYFRKKIKSKLFGSGTKS